jgi:hypothetical protein
MTPSGCPVTPGFPIRTSPDQCAFDHSPGLFAAYHVLHRLSTPRHPPCTLNSLTTLMIGSLACENPYEPNIGPHAPPLARDDTRTQIQNSSHASRHTGCEPRTMLDTRIHETRAARTPDEVHPLIHLPKSRPETPHKTAQLPRPADPSSNAETSQKTLNARAGKAYHPFARRQRHQRPFFKFF